MCIQPESETKHAVNYIFTDYENVHDVDLIRHVFGANIRSSLPRS